MMAVTVQRFDVGAHPEHGRPRVAEFVVPKKGTVSVRCDRGDGSLWLFVVGPAGGDRGTLAFGLKRAGDVAAFAADGSGVLGAGDYALTLRRPGRYVREEMRVVEEETDDRMVTVRKGGSMSPWSARFDAAAVGELLACLREWAGAAIARDPGAYAPKAVDVVRVRDHVAGMVARAERAENAAMAAALGNAVRALDVAAGAGV